MYDIFISYKHDYSGDKAELLQTILENKGFAKRVSLDKANLSGNYGEEILRRIDNCKDFIIIIGEQTFRNLNPDHFINYRQLANCQVEEFDSIKDSLPFTLDWMRLELARAIAKNKNIIPIVLAYSSKYNFYELERALPNDVKKLVKYHAVFCDENSSLTFPEIIETKVIGKNNKTLLRSTPKNEFRKGLIKVVLGIFLIIIVMLFFKEYMGFKKCRTIEEYESFIMAKPFFYAGRAESKMLELKNMLKFEGVKSDILGEDVDFLTLKKVSFKQAEALSSILTNMVYVEGGTFMMGTDGVSEKESPMHSVQVGNFYIGRYECSVAEWFGILDKTCEGYQKDSLSAPMVNISWEDAVVFVAKLNEILPGLNFSLPHEKEWEYAAGGGQLSMGYEYAGGNDPLEVAWTSADSLAVPQVRPSDGILWWKESNELGIFNMSGNVAEFCENKFYYYSSPQKEFKLDLKVIRGGSFLQDSKSCKIYSRDLVSTKVMSKGIGLRLVLRKN